MSWAHTDRNKLKFWWDTESLHCLKVPPHAEKILITQGRVVTFWWWDLADPPPSGLRVVYCISGCNKKNNSIASVISANCASPNGNHEESFHKFKTKGYSKSYWPVIFKTAKVAKVKERLRNCDSSKVQTRHVNHDNWLQWTNWGDGNGPRVKQE